MTRVRDAVLACLNKYEDEEQLISQLNHIIQEKGEESYRIILHIFTHLDLESDEAAKCWKEIISLYHSMCNALGRKVSLRTAICEYFCTITKSLKNPKVVEIHVFEKTLKESKYDGLTSLLNRQALDDILSNEYNRAKRHKLDLSFIFFDLDNFKRVNDTYSHLAGDEALRRVSNTIIMEKRLEDVAARYGGEELVLLLPETNKTNARIIGERIRKRVESMTIKWNGSDIKLTISGGLTAFPEEASDVESLVQLADEAVLRAKDSGKNKIM
jgi:diguanylate cyclase (GGDEF)-like protein